ncbi:hypothetical protein L7F22_058664 [Adiantum nelumboides]|nr:hypothetical protein [Adiantum nelumboides]
MRSHNPSSPRRTSCSKSGRLEEGKIQPSMMEESNTMKEEIWVIKEDVEKKSWAGVISATQKKVEAVEKWIEVAKKGKPDVEAERKRIEAKNPTPRKPLVVNVDGTWRVGGLLALSRAFGDAYLKDWSDGKMDGARGGFGLTAEPTVAVETLGADDDLIILGTDGLFEEISNQEIVDICRTARSSSSAESIAKQLIQLAQKRGVTDDVSAVVVFLPQGDAS